MTCEKCGAKLDVDSKFCDMCGEKIETDEVKTAKTQKAKTKKQYKLFYILLSSGVLASVVAVVLAIIFIFSPSAAVYTFYIKNGDLYYADLTKNSKYEIADELNDSTPLAVLSENGKRLFYYDRYSTNDGTFSLFYFDVKDLDETPTKLESDLSGVFYVNKKGDKVTYLKDDTLYQHNLKSKTKISDNVIDFAVSPDGDRAVFVDEKKNVFFSDIKSCSKAASEIDEFVYLTEDYKTFYYLKENTLYKQTEGKDNVRIARDVLSVDGIYETGEVLYTKISTAKLKCSDYIFDNKASADAALKRPIAPEPNKNVNAYLEEYNKYKELQNAYLEKIDRDNIRSEMNDSYFSLSLKTLYMYSEKNGEQLIVDYVYFYQFVSDKYPVAVACTVDVENIEKTNITELKNIDSLAQTVHNKMYNKQVTTVAAYGASQNVCEKTVTNTSLSDDGKTLIYIINNSDLFKVNFTDTISEPEHIATDVVSDGGKGDTLSFFEAGFMSDGSVYYGKRPEKNLQFDIYIKDKRIAEDVIYAEVDPYSKDSVYYLDDYDEANKKATLHKYKDGLTSLVSEDAYIDYSVKDSSIEILPNGDALFFYSARLVSKGELNYYNGKKVISVDDSVSHILRQDSFEDMYKENRKIHLNIKRK